MEGNWFGIWPSIWKIIVNIYMQGTVLNILHRLFRLIVKPYEASQVACPFYWWGKLLFWSSHWRVNCRARIQTHIYSAPKPILLTYITCYIKIHGYKIVLLVITGLKMLQKKILYVKYHPIQTEVQKPVKNKSPELTSQFTATQ